MRQALWSGISIARSGACVKELRTLRPAGGRSSGRVTAQERGWGSCSHDGVLRFQLAHRDGSSSPCRYVSWCTSYAICGRSLHDDEFWQQLAVVLPDYQLGRKSSSKKVHDSCSGSMPVRRLNNEDLDSTRTRTRLSGGRAVGAIGKSTGAGPSRLRRNSGHTPQFAQSGSLGAPATMNRRIKGGWPWRRCSTWCLDASSAATVSFSSATFPEAVILSRAAFEGLWLAIDLDINATKIR